MNPVLGLYPIFFAMAFQWCSFKGIGGYNSATVFSTNNLRQFVSAVTLFADEKKQEHERARRDMIPKGECIYFDEAYERGMKLQQLELSKLDVNMFAAVNNSLINDGCGLYRGRQILPYEHLSRFQNDLRS